VTVTCATDGNHGRSVAWGAQMFGCGCMIYLHAHVSEAREKEISKYGALITRIAGNYDESVRQCAEDAQVHGRMLVADTSAGGGDSSVPAIVMQGYTVMADEFLSQMTGSPLTHVFVQGGVGGIAAAVAGHLWETLGSKRPRMVVVEPTRADCIYRSIEAGVPTHVPGDFETFMACLAAGQVSPLAWPILKYATDDVLTLPEAAAADTMRYLAIGADGDPPIVSGESGCAATAGLIAAASDQRLCRELGLGASSHIVVIGSEGATDEEIYRRVVGRSPDQVSRRAA
jgi:diaminopropionate ammonia-lyase